MTDQPHQLPAEPAKRPKPPNRPIKPGVKPTPKPKPPTGRPKPTPQKVVTGGMSVTITIGETTISISGPVAQVMAVLQTLFGVSSPEAVISKLKLVFGPEKVRVKA